ncbi:ArsR/SmtB family transcription factor [Marinicella rhabdoformis]|uniref:ArsR/SmtB family transcription factor n=1 Tax=Marinicella rhabdoformis TaxID=2580566 RepID=UPI0012AEC260|nr:metalloregulator ArsR/SmtB family transcription factor [Marinicella rhabdoformis]
MEMVELMKALGHETRLRVLHLLIVKGGLCVCDLFEVLQLPQPTVSRHLKLLRDADLVSGFRENQWMHYQVNADVPSEIMAVVSLVVAGAQKDSLLQADLKRLQKVKLAVCC